MTLDDIKNHLLRLDEVTLLEVLGITSEDLIDRFGDFIELKADELEEDLEEDEMFYQGDLDFLDGKEDS